MRAKFAKLAEYESRDGLQDVAAMTLDGRRETLSIDELVARLNYYSAAIEMIENKIKEHKLERVFGLE